MRGAAVVGSWVLFLATWPAVVAAGSLQVVPDVPDTPADPPQAFDTPADSVLGARLAAVYASFEEFDSVTFTVTEGVVRITGTVANPEVRRRLGELTKEIPGVVYAVSEVETATDVETRLTPAVAQIREYWDAFVAQLPVLAVAFVVVLLFWGASFMLGRWRRPSGWSGINPLLWSFMTRLVRGILMAVGLLLAFDILGITSLMGAVLGTAGIIGLAIGFAFKDIVENYLAGMLLSLRRPFSVNDLILVGEFEGRVVRLTSRELVLLTLEGNHVRLPNAHVFKTPFTNFTINPRRLFRFEVGISVDEELQHALAVGVGTLEAMAGVMNDPPPFGRVRELGDSTVTVRFHGWVDQRSTDFLKVRSEAIRLVKAALDAEGIVMPEPTYRVLTRALPERKAPAAASPGDVETEAARIDVEPDLEVEQQVLAELEASDDENLLR